MTTRRFTISNIILYILLCGMIFFIQHIVAIDLNDPFRNFSVSEYTILFSIVSLVGAWYFYYEYKQRKLKLNFPLFVILLAFFIISVVVTFTYPETTVNVFYAYSGGTETIITHVSMEERFLFVLVDLFSLLFIYIFLAVIPLKIHSTRHLNFVFYLILLFGISAIAYSFITELDVYTSFFKTFSFDFVVSSKSFVNNPNGFALILLLASYSCLFLHHTTHRVWWYIPAVLIYLLIFPTNCRTNIAIGGLTLLGYFVVRIIFTYKKRPYINSIIVFAFVFFVATIAISYYFYVANGMTYNSIIIAKLRLIIENFLAGNRENRRYVIKRAVHLLDQGYWTIGLGVGLFSSIFFQYYYFSIDESMKYSGSPHNGFYQTMGTGGWLLLSFLTVVFLYLFWMMIRIYRRHKTLVLLTTFILIGFGFRLIYEGATPLIPSSPIADCLGLTIFTFVPVSSTYYHECHTDINKEIAKESEELSSEHVVFKKPFAVGQTISLLGVLSFGVVASLLYFYQFDLIWIIIAGSLLVISIAVPLLVEFLIQKKDFVFVEYLKEVLLPYLYIAIGYGGIAIGLQLVVSASYLISVSIAVGFPFIFIGLFCVIPYFNKRTGLITPILDVITKVYERHLVKKMSLSDKPDRPTLYEKATRIITPKPFRNEE